MNLPSRVGGWTRAETPRRVTAATIFDYMDGGGELYLAYRFDHLDVFEYVAADAAVGTILVELYWMRGSDDAFGLLSTDWTGEPIPVGGEAGHSLPTVPPHRALYGAGLLRLWSDNLYVRILASRETPASRGAVLQLARAIVEPRRTTLQPAFLVSVPQRANGAVLRTDRTCFFRSHLVLNSAFFVASKDILGLGPAVDAVTTEYARPGGMDRPMRLILVRYQTPEAAAAGLTAFVQAYVPEAAKKESHAAAGAVQVEHGFVAWAQKGHALAIVVDAADSQTGRALADAAARSH